jgi:hypothetical protein
MFRAAFKQGDQIGRLFAYLAIIFSGKFFESCRSSQNLLSTYFFHGKSCVVCFNFDKRMLGNILGDFFSKTHLVTLLSEAFSNTH